MLKTTAIITELDWATALVICNNPNAPLRMKILASEITAKISNGESPTPEEIEQVIETYNNYMQLTPEIQDAIARYCTLFNQTYESICRNDSGKNTLASIVSEYLQQYHTLPSSTQLKERINDDPTCCRLKLVPMFLSDNEKRLPVALDYATREQAIAMFPNYAESLYGLNQGQLIPIGYYIRFQLSPTDTFELPKAFKKKKKLRRLMSHFVA